MQPHIPQALPPADLNWEALIPLIGKANRSLATYAGILEALLNPEVLLSPITTQEAVLSSRIEGTQATLGDVLKFEAGEAPKQRGRSEDIQEILNYRKALRAAEGELPRRPFSLDMLRGLHKILLDSVRGKEKTPGRFRTTQNWIGAEGCKIEEAAFVPPPPSIVVDHMETWIDYYRGEQPDPLVQLGVIHAQFEVIHPFNDGNGRLGRILIPLYLFEKGLLRSPVFYLSAWLEPRRAEYVQKLRGIGRDADGWNAWCEFFLRGIQEQAVTNAETARAILELYGRLKERVIDLTHSQFAVPLLDLAFRRPIFKASDLEFGPRPPSKPTVASLLIDLVTGKVLKVLRTGRGRRPTIYALAELINLCEGKKVV